MEFNATFLVSIISFLVFMKIMNAIFYIPLTSVIEEREGLVHDNLETSKSMREKADAIFKDKEERLTESAKKARQILVDKTNEANSILKTQTDDAKTTAAKRTEELKTELSKAENDARATLNSKTEELAHTIVGKVLGGLNG